MGLILSPFKYFLFRDYESIKSNFILYQYPNYFSYTYTAYFDYNLKNFRRHISNIFIFISDFINFVIFFLIHLILDIILVKKLKETLEQKSTSITSNIESNLKQNSEAVVQGFKMIIINGILNFFLRHHKYF